jgi:hypothetical protein
MIGRSWANTTISYIFRGKDKQETLIPMKRKQNAEAMDKKNCCPPNRPQEAPKRPPRWPRSAPRGDVSWIRLPQKCPRAAQDPRERARRPKTAPRWLFPLRPDSQRWHPRMPRRHLQMAAPRRLALLGAHSGAPCGAH